MHECTNITNKGSHPQAILCGYMFMSADRGTLAPIRDASHMLFS